MPSIKNSVKNISLSQIGLILSVLAVGTFHEFISCILSALLIAGVAFYILKNGEMKLYMNVTLLTVGVITLLYLISPLWAVDGGMALLGFFKFLPLILYLFLLFQEPPEAREQAFFFLPLAAAAMVIVSAGLSFIPSLHSTFTVADRLSGFFEYPNTFALFLLIAELITLTAPKKKVTDYILLAVLVGGMLYSGSRTVFVLAILSNAVTIFLASGKKSRLVFLAVLAAAVAAVVLVSVFGHSVLLERFTRFSWKESTFVGRLLYFRDALPVILKHPFGLGYLGYYYMQPSFQTGLYSVRFIHNDFLQLMLDIGWIPALLLAWITLKPVFSKDTSLRRRLILSILFLHTCFDFDLQFVALFMILLLTCDYRSGKEIVLRQKGALVTTVCSVFFAASVYFGIALCFSYANKTDTALKLYPLNTQDKIAKLSQIESPEEMDKMADDILSHNEYVPVAYSAKALYAYSRGDFASMINYKKSVFEKAPFLYEDYEDYCQKLMTGIQLYRDAGDENSAYICLKELRNVPQLLRNVGDRLSPLGKIIKDQPVLELPEEILQYIAESEQ